MSFFSPQIDALLLSAVQPEVRKLKDLGGGAKQSACPADVRSQAGIG